MSTYVWILHLRVESTLGWRVAQGFFEYRFASVKNVQLSSHLCAFSP
jgi:hypothetical protein